MNLFVSLSKAYELTLVDEWDSLNLLWPDVFLSNTHKSVCGLSEPYILPTHTSSVSGLWAHQFFQTESRVFSSS